LSEQKKSLKNWEKERGLSAYQKINYYIKI